MKYKIIKNSNNQNEIQSELTSKIWPEFMHHDIIVNKYWKYLFNNFLSFQIAYVLGKTTVGIANSIPLRWDKDFYELPDEGFDWALEKAVNDYNNNVRVTYNIYYSELGENISIDCSFLLYWDDGQYEKKYVNDLPVNELWNKYEFHSEWNIYNTTNLN